MAEELSKENMIMKARGVNVLWSYDLMEVKKILPLMQEFAEQEKKKAASTLEKEIERLKGLIGDAHLFGWENGFEAGIESEGEPDRITLSVGASYGQFKTEKNL